jgi:hypothetical protein
MKNKVNIFIISLLCLVMSSCDDVKKESKSKEHYILGQKYNNILPFGKSKDIVNAIAENTENSFIIDTVKESIIGNVYYTENGMDEFSEGLIRFKSDELIGFLNELGEIIIEPKHEEVSVFKNGHAITGSFLNKGLINKKGDELLPNTYTDIHTGKDSLGFIKVDFVGDSFTINTFSYNDTSNIFELPYGTFYNNEGKIKIYPLELDSSKNIYYEYYSNSSCGKQTGTIDVLTKNKMTNNRSVLGFSFGNNNESISMFSINKTNCIYNKGDCTDKWGTYYKDKSKLITKD